MKDGAVQAVDGEGVDAKRAETEARQSAEGQQALEVVLYQGDERAIENAEDRQQDHDVGNAARFGWEEAEVKTDKRVEAELAGNDHRHGSRSFTEDVPEPPVQR